MVSQVTMVLVAARTWYKSRGIARHSVMRHLGATLFAVGPAQGDDAADEYTNNPLAAPGADRRAPPAP